MHQSCSIILFFAVAFASLNPGAQSSDFLIADDESSRFTAKTVLNGLDNPCGLAIRPGRDALGPHELFIAESGAGRVIRITTDQPRDVNEAIVGFPLLSFASIPSIRAGPLGLAFLTRTKLIVTGGQSENGKRDANVYVLPGDNSSMTYNEQDHAVGLRRNGESPQIADAFLWGVATNEAAAFISMMSDSAKGRILKADIEKNRLETLRGFSSDKDIAKLTHPGGITFTPSDRPQFLVVADQGSLDTPSDSRLTFQAIGDGRPILNLSTGLHDITGLAYSPSGQLYAVDCSWNDAGQGGVYRLDDAYYKGYQVCQAVKVASIPRGVALAFAPDGALYVTALGKSENEKDGSVIKITGKF